MNLITLRKSDDRGHANHGWLDSRFSFSFADYHDREHMNFRALRVINEDHIAPGMGFGTHPHRDMEIITYVVSGALRHQDSMGNTAVMRAGDVQRISAGTGIAHSEFNDSPAEPVHLLQIWIMPDQQGRDAGLRGEGIRPDRAGRTAPHCVEPWARRIDLDQSGCGRVCRANRGRRHNQAHASARTACVGAAHRRRARGKRRDARGGRCAAVSAAEALELRAAASAHFLLFDLN